MLPASPAQIALNRENAETHTTSPHNRTHNMKAAVISSLPRLGEGTSRLNLLGRGRRANDGVAVHMYGLATTPAESRVRDCRFLSRTRRLADARSSTAGCVSS